MSILNSYFDKIYCINLDRRQDRWTECEIEFAKHKLLVERVSAVDGNPDNIKMSVTDNRIIKPGMIGCAMSHLKVVLDAKLKNYRNILILEDDISFINDLNDVFETYMLQVPSSWQLLYFGGNHLGSHNVFDVSNNVVRITNTYTTHCIGMKSSMYDVMINRIPNHITNPIDVIYAEWQKQYESYCIRPHLCWQRESFSDIDNMPANYDSIIKNFHFN